MIKRFHLGFSPESSDALYREASRRGYSEKYLIETGLCARSERNGQIYDRFRGRVIYPVFTLSGKVVAFGGRTLKTDKSMAKYVNSPESKIYSKRRELYGLYQAKSTISKLDKCILVEGYMDVISMHQAGVTNVVASSGTSLTTDQIRVIHRFTSNVTVIYDSDPAGIKASLRGIDMLLAEGLNIKVLLLPDGDDPDSFAQNHSATEVEEYIAQNETDFIRFKTSILLKGVENDPLRRSAVITDIVKSIAVIPDEITRSVYIQECSRMLDMDEKVLQREVARHLGLYLEKSANRNSASAKYGIFLLNSNRLPAMPTRLAVRPTKRQPPQSPYRRPNLPAPRTAAESRRPFGVSAQIRTRSAEIRPEIRHALFCDIVGENGETQALTVIGYIAYILEKKASLSPTPTSRGFSTKPYGSATLTSTRISPVALSSLPPVAPKILPAESTKSGQKPPTPAA